MNDKTELHIARLIKELDTAVMSGDTEKADELSHILFRLQGGTEEDAVMPMLFPLVIAVNKNIETGGHIVKSKSIKRIVCIAAAAVLIMALSITALATNLFGIRYLVIGNDHTGSAAISDDTEIDSGTAVPSGDANTAAQNYDLIAMQGYPDSNEYKASKEWNIFCNNYDTDGSIISKVGNNPNDFTEKYPMYLVYSQEMADKIEEIITKYGLTLHTSMTIAENPEELISLAGTGNFLENKNNNGVNKVLGGYVYNDGTFAYDGDAILANSAVIAYQFANYVKGTFSEPCLNIGNADTYNEWLYTTTSGVKVSLALSENKSLIIADLENSFVTVNVLAGTGEDSGFGSSSITADDLQSFADMFDFTQIN